MRVVVFMIAILAVSRVAFSQSNFLDHNYIEVQGKATIKVIPDQIYLRIQISEKEKTKTNLEVKEREMIKRLKDLGIDIAKELTIKDMASNFNPKIFADDNIVISKVYILLVHDAATANKVISKMKELEISNIKVDHLDHSRLTEFKKECSVKAIVAAKAKAESLTQAVGQSIGRALYIEEIPLMNIFPGQAQNYRYDAGAGNSYDKVDTDLEYDEITVEYVVMARFELK